MCGLVLLLSFLPKRVLKVKQVVGVYSHQSHDWPRVYFVLFSLNSWVPKFVRAVKCFRILQIHLEELKAGDSTISYYFRCDVYELYSDMVCMYIKIQICISKLCYEIYLFVPLWDSCYSDVVFFFFFYSNFLSYLFSPSNFFLLMIWNVRYLNN